MPLSVTATLMFVSVLSDHRHRSPTVQLYLKHAHSSLYLPGIDSLWLQRNDEFETGICDPSIDKNLKLRDATNGQKDHGVSNTIYKVSPKLRY